MYSGHSWESEGVDEREKNKVKKNQYIFLIYNEDNLKNMNCWKEDLMRIVRCP